MTSKKGLGTVNRNGGGGFVVENREMFRDGVEKTLEINEKKDIKIISLEVQKKTQKITILLNDDRELSIPINWFAKWGIKNVTADKLKKYEIWQGSEIYFPDIDEVLGVETFIDGFDASCE